MAGGAPEHAALTHTATNPTLIVEVLSDGTEDYDRGEKREHYFTIASLREYLLVSQKDRGFELWRRSPEGWLHQKLGPGERLELSSIGCELDVDAIYDAALP